MLIWFNVRKLTQVIYRIDGLKEAERVSDVIQHDEVMVKKPHGKIGKEGTPLA